jgi:acetyltransferase
MSTYRLDRLFAPRSVAVVGASPREGSLGGIIFRRLRCAGLPGPIYPVNPKHAEMDGVACFSRLGDLPNAPDLVVVASPPSSVPGVIKSAGEAGVAGVVVISSGLGHGPGSLADAARLEARRHGLRLVGPNCLGIMAPHASLNASFAAQAPVAGNLAVVS